MESVHPFLRALDLVGNAAMATALNVSRQMVWKMAKAAEMDPDYQVPANHLRAIEAVTENRVTVDQLVINRQTRQDHSATAS